MYRFDYNTVVPPSIDESDKFSKQNAISYQSSWDNKSKKTLHNVCISVSSSSDDDEIFSPPPKFVPLAEHHNIQADTRTTHAVKYRCESSLLHPELPDLDSKEAHPELPDLNCKEVQDQNKFGQIHSQQVVRNDKREKALKCIVKDSKNTIKSKQLALKSIHIEIDHSVASLDDAESLWTLLQNMEINYSLTDNAVNFSILWQQENVDCEISEDGEVIQIIEKCPEDHVLIIFPATNFIDMVQDFKWHLNSGCVTNVLLECANNHKTQFPDKNITYVIIGVDKYFREKKNKQNKKYRSMARGKTNEYATGNSQLVSFDDVEEATVCLQIHEDIICYMVDTVTDLAALILSFSKGIAEAPFKKENQQKAFLWYAEADSCKGVKVSNSSEGLLQLWAQQVQQFPLVSQEVADAIVSYYPSPQLLLQAYKTCNTTQEAEKLLKDIVIRRGVGPLVTTRHIGPELSRKIYHFFTEEVGTMLL